MHICIVNSVSIQPPYGVEGQGEVVLLCCKPTVAAREACSLVLMSREQWNSEFTQMIILWGSHNVFVRNAQRAPGWHSSFWEPTLAADAPLSSTLPSYSSSSSLLEEAGEVTERKGAGEVREGREDGLMWCSSVQWRQDAVQKPITKIFLQLLCL